MERIYRLITQRPVIVLGILAVVTGFLGWHAREIRLDSSVETLLPEDDSGKRYYDEIRALYGSDEIGVVALIADDVFRPETLRRLARLTEAIEEVDGVESVVSLTNAPDPVADAVEPPKLIPAIPTDDAGRQALREKLADRPFYQKNLASPDGRAAAINIRFENLGDEEFMRRGIDDAVVAILESDEGPGELFYSGLPHFKVHTAKAMLRDLVRFVPLTLAVIVVVLFLSFRSLRGVLLPAITVIVSLTWVLGIMALLGSNITLGSTSLPPLILVIGTAYSLHLVAEYYEVASGRTPAEAALETLRRVGAPVLITAVTTVLGFLSFGANRIPSIREMGIYSALGITIAFLLSTVLVPALLALLPLPRVRSESDVSERLGHALARLGAFSMQHRTTLLVAAAAIAIATAVPIPSIPVDSNFQSFFRESDPVRRATDAINENLVGTAAFYVAIDSEEKGIVKKWDTLRRIKDLQIFLEQQPGVDKTSSFVDYVESFDRGAQQVTGGDILVGPDGEIVETPAEPGEQKTFWENPDQLGASIQLIVSNPKAFASVVNADFSRTNVLVRTSLSKSTDIADLVEKIGAFAKRRFPPELVVRSTGNLILLTRTTDDIVAGQIQSLAFTAGIIFVIMSGMFLSVRVGLIAMVPNLFPILVLFGLMGAVGAPLNLATSMIAAIALGIAVDDTVHVMARLSAEVRATGDQERALLNTLSTVGKPAVYTSILLVFGFLILTFSTFVPIVQFGFLSAAAILFALGADVVLTPALVSTTRIITLWDLLYLKLGPNPHETIGIFANLRPWQAKIVALMGELRSFRSGEAIVRAGEVGNAMYVIIGGRAIVQVDDSGGRKKVVNELGRGDVFGEMGLLRRHHRTADVVAEGDVEVMTMDERFLSRVQRRYPRIASKIFFNISRILSDRLEAQTERSLR